MALVLPATAAPTEPVKHYEWLGTMGPRKVGANLVARNDRELVTAHYFDAQTLVDIPLTGQVVGDSVTLRDPGGGVFDLHFETDDKTAKHPLDFSTSTALTGTWTDNGRSLPVRLRLDSIGDYEDADRYKDVTDAPAPVFEALVRRFLHGAVTGDRGETLWAVSFPLTVNAGNTAIVRSRAQFSQRWSTIFTPCFVATLKEAVPHEMFVRNGAAMVADGAAWFGPHGVVSLNLPACPKG